MRPNKACYLAALLLLWAASAHAQSCPAGSSCAPLETYIYGSAAASAPYGSGLRIPVAPSATANSMQYIPANTLVTSGGALGTPSSGTLTNATGLPVGGISGFGTNVATALGINVGSPGAFLVNGGALGTPSSGTLTNASGLPVGGIAGLGGSVATALGVAVGSAGAFAKNNGDALSGTYSGTPTFSGNIILSGVPVLSGLSSGTIASGKNLGLDSSNNLVVNTVATGNSGMTSGQVPLAGSATTLTNSFALGTGVQTYLTTPTAANLVSATPGVARLDLADQTLTGGANVTSASLGTKTTGTVTIDCGTNPLQYLTNGGTWTLAAPAADGSCSILVTNNGSAGTITPSGFSVGVNTGDSLDTTNGHKFIIDVRRINGTAMYSIQAGQ